MAQDNTDRNLNDLMSAAQKKLEFQKKQEEQGANTDIYAEMRDEAQSGPQYRETTIQHAPTTQNNAVYDGEIMHDPDENGGYNPSLLGVYIDPEDTPIFEGGPGISQVNLWKKQFENENVYHVKILARHFVFRTLNRFEYKQIIAVENVDSLYREEMICRTCVLFPYNYDFKVMAVEDSGYPSTLAEIIMENSGFTKEYGIEVL